MKKTLFVLFFIPYFAASQNIFVNYSAPIAAIICAGGHQTSPCGGFTTITDARDGKVYNVVQTGTGKGIQCWMAENLNYSTSGSYTAIHGGAQLAGEKYCQNLSGVDDASCPFGGLYEWANMMNGSSGCNGDSACPPCLIPIQGICPSGWHIPSHYEWTLLEKNAGSNPGAFHYNVTDGGFFGTNEGSNLKQAGTANWTAPNAAATNSTGFTALPGGDSWFGGFQYNGTQGAWWSTTETAGLAWLRDLVDTNAGVLRGWNNEAFGHSVRCIKN